MGGAIFHFLQKIGLKSTKNMRFCILYKPMGGARAPPAPPLATLLSTGIHCGQLAMHYNTFTIRFFFRNKWKATSYSLKNNFQDLVQSFYSRVSQTCSSWVPFAHILICSCSPKILTLYSEKKLALSTQNLD